MIDKNSKISSEQKKILKSNSDKIYYANSALEDYLENNFAKNNDAINNIFKKIGDFWKQKQIINECELLNLSNDLVNEIEKIYDLLGREKFTFYADGMVEYKWN